MAEEFNPQTIPTLKRNYSISEIFGNVTDAEDEDAFLRLAVYAEPGHGKTWSSVELAQRITPPEKNILYVYTADNWTSIKKSPKLMQRLKKKPYKDFDEIRDLCAALKDPKVREKTKIGAVIFDEFNTMFDINVETLTNFRSVQKMKEEGKFKDPDTPEWPEYNTAKRHMDNLMNDVLATPDIHFIFVAHVRQGKRTRMKEPDFFDKAAQSFMRPLNSVYFLSAEEEAGKVVRRFQLQGTDQITAKNRIAGLGTYAYSVKEIADAYKAWGPAEKAPVESHSSPSVSVRETALTEPVEAPPKPTTKEDSPQVIIEDEPVIAKADADDLMALLDI